MKEWKENEYFDESWRHRIQKMASYIEQGEVVADLGCGEQWLREYLPSSADYVPVDYRERSKDTLVCDFNRYEFPNMFVDTAVISGALEYVNDAEWFAGNVINHTAKKIILSYCSTEMVPSFSQRKKNMWVNHYSNKEIQYLFSQSGFELVEKGKVGANDIFVMTREPRQEACGVIVHEDAPGNLGDFTQALAAKVILGDEYHAVHLNRESLHLYRGKKLPVICNGWFSHTPVQPPSDRLVPLYISLHITPGARKWFSTDAMVTHLINNAPIGCRDSHTRDFLLSMGVNAYFSGCLTYALGVKLRERWSGVVEKSVKSQQVYLVDPPVGLVKNPLAILRALGVLLRYIPLAPRIWPLAIEQRGILRRWLFVALLVYEYRKIIQQCRATLVFQTQFLGKDEQTDYDSLYSRIQERLLGYYQGKAVVTGRIHVAIPATFSGANVVFLQPESLGIADIPRVSDHARIFKQVVALDKPDSEDEILGAIRRDDIRPINTELAKDQIQTVHKAVREFYENTCLH